ncbi:MAG: sigma-70 family RNA polymerase sigma factor [Planctomycetes bacterium]|nr:sigma-70 family RNA polymerase sigma factor [Planctomycetota bacterium]
MTDGAFHTTRWSLVQRLASGDPEAARRALDELCELYWQPLYAFARRRGLPEPEALDAVQSFCAQLLERGGPGGADRDRGRFRSYLLGAFRHHQDNLRRHERVARRGGGAVRWSFDDAERRYGQRAAAEESPERAFERSWAMALLERATARLREEYAARGRQQLLAQLEPTLLGSDDAVPHQRIADELQTTEGAVKAALHRMRRRMGELIRDEIGQTVLEQAEVDEELRHLLAVLAR